MPFNEHFSHMILNFTMAKGNVVGPTEVWVGLTTNTNGTGELAGSGYTRILISKKNSSEPRNIGVAGQGLKDEDVDDDHEVPRTIQNVQQINWNKATADWPTIKGFALYMSNDPKDGEDYTLPFFYGALEEPITVQAGEVALFDPGTLKITLPE